MSAVTTFVRAAKPEESGVIGSITKDDLIHIAIVIGSAVVLIGIARLMSLGLTKKWAGEKVHSGACSAPPHSVRCSVGCSPGSSFSSRSSLCCRPSASTSLLLSLGRVLPVWRSGSAPRVL